jgi:DNA-binding HxlR family transcriptional regulator
MEPTETALDYLRACCENIDGKWKGAIIFHLMNGTKRFSELKRLLDGVTQRVLTLELRQLEESGIILRRVYAQVPPKVEYSLSELGSTLEPIIQLKQSWGKEYLRLRALQKHS